MSIKFPILFSGWWNIHCSWRRQRIRRDQHVWNGTFTSITQQWPRTADILHYWARAVYSHWISYFLHSTPDLSRTRREVSEGHLQFWRCTAGNANTWWWRLAGQFISYIDDMWFSILLLPPWVYPVSPSPCHCLSMIHDCFVVYSQVATRRTVTLLHSLSWCRRCHQMETQL